MNLADNELYVMDTIEFMEQIPDNYYNLIYTDVPYNMGSVYVIDKETGHYRFKGKGQDFMAKWEAFDGLWWDKWFAQAYRILKEGGFLVTHNIDRQSDLWTYYGRRNNFFPTQKLYWMFLSNFPKGVDVALALDKKAGVEREKIGMAKGAQAKSTGKYAGWGNGEEGSSMYMKTTATSDLAKKYDGYKYGQASLKQILEEIIVLQKPLQNITAPEAIIKMEEDFKNNRPSKYHSAVINIKDTSVPDRKAKRPDRYTPQLLVDEKIFGVVVRQMSHDKAMDFANQIYEIKYLSEDFTPYRLEKKPDKTEKDAGLDGFEVKLNNKANVGTLLNEKGKDKWASELKNPHPTPKPINLAKWILTLFSLPDRSKMRMYDPFTGSGSILIAAELMGIKYNGTDINEEYIKVAKARINYHKQEQQFKLF